MIGDAIKHTYIGVLRELVSGDIVNREAQLDVLVLGLLNKSVNNLSASLVEQGVADLSIYLSKLLLDCWERLTLTPSTTFLNV